MGDDDAENDHGPAGSSVEATLTAMRSGVDVIYQATLEDDRWSGRADFLRKVDAPSNLGSWSSRHSTPRLARETKAGTILQLCVYILLAKRSGEPIVLGYCQLEHNRSVPDLNGG